MAEGDACCRRGSKTFENIWRRLRQSLQTTQGKRISKPLTDKSATTAVALAHHLSKVYTYRSELSHGVDLRVVLLYPHGYESHRPCSKLTALVAVSEETV